MPDGGPSDAGARERARAAGLLGRTYGALLADGRGTLGQWALPTRLNVHVDTALGRVFPGGGDYMGAVGPWDRRAWYRTAFEAVIPDVRAKAHAWALGMLDTEKSELTVVRAMLADPATATELHLAARRAEDTARGHELSDEARERLARGGRAPVPGTTSERVLRRRLAPHIAAQRNAVLSRLFGHPFGVELVWKLSDGAARGQQRAVELLDEATGAIDELVDDVKGDPDRIWRFRPAVLAGVVQLGLADRPGFPEYSVQIAAVLGRSAALAVIDHLGAAVFAVGLGSGPVGMAAAGVVDLALAGASVAVVFLREREESLAATATAFRPESERLATPPSYLQTALAGAAALIGAKAVLNGSLRRVLAAPSGRPRPVPPGGAAPELAPPEVRRVPDGPRVPTGRAVGDVRGVADRSGGGASAGRTAGDARGITDRGGIGVPAGGGAEGVRSAISVPIGKAAGDARGVVGRGVVQRGVPADLASAAQRDARTVTGPSSPAAVEGAGRSADTRAVAAARGSDARAASAPATGGRSAALGARGTGAITRPPKPDPAYIREVVSTDRPGHFLPATDPDLRSVASGRNVYTVDGRGRPLRAEGWLFAQPAGRRQSAQSFVSGRHPGSDAAHLIADRFHGSSHAVNLVPFSRDVNQRAMADFERGLADRLTAGRELYAQVSVRYADAGFIPAEIRYEVFEQQAGRLSRTDVIVFDWLGATWRH